MLPPLTSNEQWRLDVPFENNASERGRVVFTSQVIQKLCVFLGEFFRTCIKALTSIINDGQTVAHGINERYQAFSIA
jgi:hypothetical protein